MTVSSTKSFPLADALPRASAPALAPEAISLRPCSRIVPRVLVVGASTGGPQALATVVAGLAEVIAFAPVLSPHQ
jgi:two-component system chemotaxis response regulator CheB